MESPSPTRNPTEVQMSQLVLPCHTNHCGELSTGQLLKWIDTAACLSGKSSSPAGAITGPGGKGPGDVPRSCLIDGVPSSPAPSLRADASWGPTSCHSAE